MISATELIASTGCRISTIFSWYEADECHQMGAEMSRLIALVLVILCSLASVTLVEGADLSRRLTQQQVNTVILLLSQHTHQLVPNVLGDRLVRWPAGNITYAILGSEAAPLVDEATRGVNAALHNIQASVTLVPTDSVRAANIIIVYARDPAKLISSENYTSADIFGVNGAPDSAANVASMKAAIYNPDSQCVRVNRRLDNTIAKVIVFISAARSEFLTRQCAFSMVLGGLGLSNVDVSGNSVMPPNSKIDTPTIEDVAALQVLYAPQTQSAATIGDALKLLHVNLPSGF